MATTSAPKADKSSRKDARNTIEEKLNLLLVDLKKELGDTKFKSRVKKAAKLLSKGLDKTKKKVVTVKKKAVKKTKTKTSSKKAAAVAATPETEK
jgi:hypothetical protein